MSNRKKTSRPSRKVVTKATFTEQDIKGESFLEAVSQTVPDQALSLRELLRRHTSGQQVFEYKPVYDHSEINFAKLSKAERAILTMQVIEAGDLARKDLRDIKKRLEKQLKDDIADSLDEQSFSDGADDGADDAGK